MPDAKKDAAVVEVQFLDLLIKQAEKADELAIESGMHEAHGMLVDVFEWYLVDACITSPIHEGCGASCTDCQDALGQAIYRWSVVLDNVALRIALGQVTNWGVPSTRSRTSCILGSGSGSEYAILDSLAPSVSNCLVA